MLPRYEADGHAPQSKRKKDDHAGHLDAIALNMRIGNGT